MDWRDVMARKELTLAEKRASYEADCKRRGREPYPEVYRKYGIEPHHATAYLRLWRG